MIQMKIKINRNRIKYKPMMEKLGSNAQSHSTKQQNVLKIQQYRL